MWFEHCGYEGIDFDGPVIKQDIPVLVATKGLKAAAEECFLVFGDDRRDLSECRSKGKSLQKDNKHYIAESAQNQQQAKSHSLSALQQNSDEGKLHSRSAPTKLARGVTASSAARTRPRYQ
jgi:hypothetical protein